MTPSRNCFSEKGLIISCSVAILRIQRSLLMDMDLLGTKAPEFLGQRGRRPKGCSTPNHGRPGHAARNEMPSYGMDCWLTMGAGLTRMRASPCKSNSKLDLCPSGRVG